MFSLKVSADGGDSGGGGGGGGGAGGGIVRSVTANIGWYDDVVSEKWYHFCELPEGNCWPSQSCRKNTIFPILSKIDISQPNNRRHHQFSAKIYIHWIDRHFIPGAILPPK